MMAKRKTIRVNPLDMLVPNPKPDQTGKPQNHLSVESSAVPAPAVQVAQLPAPADLISRLESLEKQNVYITWLVGGGILLLLLL
jgi:hypothetical protein